MQALLAKADKTGKQCLLLLPMSCVAWCYTVAQCCHEGLAAWQKELEVCAAVSLVPHAQRVGEQEALYAKRVWYQGCHAM
jgi:hypothetical protein